MGCPSRKTLRESVQLALEQLADDEGIADLGTGIVRGSRLLFSDDVAKKIREGTLRQEFQLPIRDDLTTLATAVYTDNIDCAAAKQSWRKYVRDELLPTLDKPKNRDLKLALRHDDPDYQATLLNAFAITCSG
jgi:hypothetical protein